MEIVVKGRNTEVSDRSRTHVNEKPSKIEQFAPRVQRVDIEITHEPNSPQAEVSERIEIAAIDRGPAICAEVAVSDRYGALDLASGKLLERLGCVRDRRKEYRRSDAHVSAPLMLTPKDVNIPKAKEQAAPEAAKVLTVLGEEVENQLGDSSAVVRQKLCEAQPISIDQALYEMELMGHPFYLFTGEETKQPCTVYHRYEWAYDVTRLGTRTVWPMRGRYRKARRPRRSFVGCVTQCNIEAPSGISFPSALSRKNTRG